MTSIFKIYPVNSEDKPGLFELIFGKRKSSDIIKPIFVKGHDYRFMDSKQSILFHGKFFEKSKIDGLPYFTFLKERDIHLINDVAYIRADNGIFKIRRVETIVEQKHA